MNDPQLAREEELHIFMLDPTKRSLCQSFNFGEEILKRTKQDLDKIDKRILSILQEDSRRSFVDLAKDLDLSETAMRNRVKKLVDTRIIKKFTLQLDQCSIPQHVSLS
jgi:predicted transcriptional regulator